MNQSIFNEMYYESKPYILIGFGIYALNLNYVGSLGKIGAVVLVICAAALLYARYRHRGLLR